MLRSRCSSRRARTWGESRKRQSVPFSLTRWAIKDVVFEHMTPPVRQLSVEIALMASIESGRPRTQVDLERMPTFLRMIRAYHCFFLS